jgi:hypothetical protein
MQLLGNLPFEDPLDLFDCGHTTVLRNQLPSFIPHETKDLSAVNFASVDVQASGMRVVPLKAFAECCLCSRQDPFILLMTKVDIVTSTATISSLCILPSRHSVILPLNATRVRSALPALPQYGQRDGSARAKGGACLETTLQIKQEDNQSYVPAEEGYEIPPNLRISP